MSDQTVRLRPKMFELLESIAKSERRTKAEQISIIIEEWYLHFGPSASTQSSSGTVTDWPTKK
jgi:hypothetical protein